jgi:predicted nucleic acid-binding protein
VLVAGISGFRKLYIRGRNWSADLLYNWVEKRSFVWLVSEDILDEYKEILARLRVRPIVIGRIVNLVRERGVLLNVRTGGQLSPDPKDDPFCQCAEQGNADFVVTLNRRDFPPKNLRAKVIEPANFPT